MKKIINHIVIMLLLIPNIVAVFANSGPVYWQGYPSSNVMSIEKNSPIEVLSENLTFDFTKNYNHDYTIGANVTASYEMFNPSSESQSVTMAFPIVERIDSFSAGDMVIAADDTILPYDVYIGDVVDSHGNPYQEEKDAGYDFGQIVSTVDNNQYEAENFESGEIGKLYVITVEPRSDTRVNFAVDFSFDSGDTKIITNGFDRYDRDESNVRIASWCYERETLEIYVLGEDIDMSINAYTDGALTEKTDLFDYDIAAEETDVRTYLLNYVKNYGYDNKYVFSDTQLYNLYSETLDKYFTNNIGITSEHDFMAQENYERILTLVYTVEFPENAGKNISVNYKTSGTMDMRETKEPQYTYDYILNPAKNWSDFKNLNIKIITPEEAPYIVKSSISLNKEENNIYTAALENLPEDDFSFTLYSKEKISAVDKIEGYVNNHFGYFTPIVLGTLAVAAAIIIILIYKRYK